MGYEGCTVEGEIGLGDVLYEAGFKPLSWEDLKDECWISPTVECGSAEFDLTAGAWLGSAELFWFIRLGSRELNASRWELGGWGLEGGWWSCGCGWYGTGLWIVYWSWWGCIRGPAGW